MAVESGDRFNRHVIEAVLVAVLLAIHATLSLTAAAQKSPTTDEVVHIAGGLSYWATDEYRLHTENGNLPQRWAALPLHLAGEGRHIDRSSPHWYHASAWFVGEDIYKAWGGDLDDKVLRARAMVTVLSVTLGLVVFLWSRSLFGPTGGFVSLVLFCFEPNFLAHGSLATSDVTASLMILLAMGAIWRVMRKATPGRLLAACAGTGLLAVSKHSAPILAPMAALMLVARLWRGGAWVAAARGHVLLALRGRARLAAALVAALLIIAISVVPMIWAFHGFRYAITTEPATLNPAIVKQREKLIAGTGAIGQAAQVAFDHRLLPEGYVHGFIYAMRTVRDRSAFFLGEYGTNGWAMFFPYSFMAKTPLPTFVVIFAAALAMASWTRTIPTERRWALCLLRAYEVVPLIVLLGVYWFFAVRAQINIGHRHMLPTYAPMFILAGAAGRWLTAAHRRRGWVVAFALAALAFEAFAYWPNYIAYFNPLSGGPSRAYRKLVDSSLDWGQDLKGLAAWVRATREAAPSEPIFISYFGTAIPSAYGLEEPNLPPYPQLTVASKRMPTELVPGWFCVSATNLQMVYDQFPGPPWTQEREETYRRATAIYEQYRATAGDADARVKFLSARPAEEWQTFFSKYDSLRMGRLAAYLRSREPDDNIGYSILIYHVDARALDEALYGPPRF